MAKKMVMPLNDPTQPMRSARGLRSPAPLPPSLKVSTPQPIAQVQSPRKALDPKVGPRGSKMGIRGTSDFKNLMGTLKTRGR